LFNVFSNIIILDSSNIDVVLFETQYYRHAYDHTLKIDPKEVI